MPDDLYNRWGQQVRAARIAASMTQAELAIKADSTKAHISNIERGITSVSDGLRMRIAAALGTTAAELFPYPDEVPAA